MLHASMLPRSLAVLLVVAVVCAAAVGGRDLAQYGDEVEDGLYGEPMEIPEYDMDVFEMEDDDPGAPDGTRGCADGTVTCKEGRFCSFGNACTRFPLEGEPCVASRFGIGRCLPGLVCVDLDGQQTSKLDASGFALGPIDFNQTQCQIP